MTWREDVGALWSANGSRYPLDFILGWVAAEQTNNSAPATALPLDEVGWFQISQAERDALGLSREMILDDEDYSYRAGLQLLDWYGRKVDGRFTNDAFFGMVKLWHTLPVVAQFVQAEFPDSATSWWDVSEWAKDNKTDGETYVRSHSQWRGNYLSIIQQVDRVMNYTHTAEGFLSPVFDSFTSDDSDTGDVVLLVGLVAVAVAIGGF